MQITKRVYKRARPKAAYLRSHHREQRVGCNVERHSKKQVRAALIQLAAQLAFQHVKLKKRMTGSQCHLIKFTDVPCTHDVPTTVWIAFDLGDDLIDLIDRTAIGCAPVAPLSSVNAAQAAILVRPFVPDRNT